MANHVNGITLLNDHYPTSEHYPFTLPILQQTRQLVFETPVTIFVGENGSGKSTLLTALARACSVHIWELSGGIRQYHVNQYERMLHLFMKVHLADGPVPGAYFGSEIFQDFKLLLDEWAVSDPGQLKYFGGESLVTKSHGQSMMAFFRARYQLRGVYFLDEPETGLSPASQIELMEIIEENSLKGHAQFFMATHSPLLMACRHAAIFSFDHVPAQTIAYHDTEHYQVYKRFLNER